MSSKATNPALALLDAKIIPYGASMPRIHVWRSNSRLRAKHIRERRAIVSRLKSQLGLDESVDDDRDGPFVIQKGDEFLIIWTDEPSRRSDAIHSALKQLGEYFDPLLSVSATRNRTAESLAKKLAL